MKQKRVYLSLFALTVLSGCVSIKVPNTTACSVAGVLAAGAICAETITGKTSDMTLDQFLDFLEPKAERPDPNDPSATIPGRAGAICQSAEDWGRIKTTLEQACRELGSKCSYELKAVIANMEVLR